MTISVVRFTVRGAETPRCSACDYTVVYDGDCKVCTRLSRMLKRWDRTHRLEVVPSQAPGVTARYPWIPAHAYAEALQMVARDGTTWSGAAAIEKILDVLPKGRLISWLFRLPFARTLADRFYRWFARNRYRLGCGDHCMTRPPDVMFADADGAAAR